MRTELEVRQQLEKEYGLYRCTNDAKVLQNECYQRIRVLEWFLKEHNDENY